MTTNPVTSGRDAMPRDDQHPSSTRGGIAARVEAASKMSHPGPRGKGLVMMLIGIAVLAAVIWDFTGHGAARKAVLKAVDRQEAVVAPSGAAGSAAEGPALELTLEHDGTELTLGATAAVAYVISAQDEAQHADLAGRVLRALAAREGFEGRAGREAFELASRLIHGAAQDARAAIDDLTIKAHAALALDAVAPAAIVFLERLPGGVDRLSARALDKVILDRERPLHIRLAAARARPAEGRPDTLARMAQDANTHPALREALK